MSQHIPLGIITRVLRVLIRGFGDIPRVTGNNRRRPVLHSADRYRGVARMIGQSHHIGRTQAALENVLHGHVTPGPSLGARAATLRRTRGYIHLHITTVLNITRIEAVCGPSARVRLLRSTEHLAQPTTRPDRVGVT